MYNDILISQGRVIDPARDFDEIIDIRIVNDRIIDNNLSVTNKTRIIDAKNCIVTPGLIDHHTHVYNGSFVGVPADLTTLPYGVTTVVDAGSSGYDNFEGFYQSVIMASKVRIKAYLFGTSSGQCARTTDCDTSSIDEDKVIALFEKYHNVLLGIKYNVQKSIAKEYANSGIQKIVDLCSRIKQCRMVVHCTEPFISSNQLVKFFRPDDVFSHCFHGIGDTILNQDNLVYPEIKQAQKAGVIFDAANGLRHFSNFTAMSALKDNFFPNIISSDMSSVTKLDFPVYGLPWILSKYLALGANLPNIIKSCTSEPAKLIKMENQIGTLSPNSYADVSIFKLVPQKVIFKDFSGDLLHGNELLIPQLTIKSGEILYRHIGF